MFVSGKTVPGIHLQNLNIPGANILQKKTLISKPERIPSFHMIHKVNSALVLVWGSIWKRLGEITDGRTLEEVE